MKTIHKYAISNGEVIELPKDAEILHVGLQGDSLFLWAYVDPNAPPEGRRFSIRATGEYMEDTPRKHIQTYMQRSQTYVQSPLVWHVFEEL